MMCLRVQRLSFIWLIAMLAIFMLPGRSPAATAKSTNSRTAAQAFKTSCTMCHGVDGSGTDLGRALHAPSLQSKEVLDQSDASLAKIVATGKNNMPPFGESLDAKQIDELIQYIRRFHRPSARQK